MSPLVPPPLDHTPAVPAAPSAPVVVDASRCPLCQQDNRCAMVQAQREGRDPPADCWCVHVTFGVELLARVPEQARRQACICHVCATAQQPMSALLSNTDP